MGTAERREREKRQIKKMILGASMELIAEEGYENLSIRKIAERIEYSPGTIYLYYEDKDEILYELHKEGFDLMLRHEQQVLAISDPIERMIKLGEVYIDFALNNHEYYDLMLITNAPMRKVEDDWESGKSAFGFARMIIGDAIRSGRCRYDNVDVATFALWSMVHGFSSLKIRNRLPMIPEDQIDQVRKGMQDFIRKTMVL